jgi:hypothetical protein
MIINMSIFIKQGHFCIVQKNNIEVQEIYIYRGYAIISQFPKKQEEYDKYQNLSRYLVNIKFLKCYYNEKIEEECKKIDKNLMINSSSTSI